MVTSVATQRLEPTWRVDLDPSDWAVQVEPAATTLTIEVLLSGGPMPEGETLHVMGELELTGCLDELEERIVSREGWYDDMLHIDVEDPEFDGCFSVTRPLGVLRDGDRVVLEINEGPAMDLDLRFSSTAMGNGRRAPPAFEAEISWVLVP